MNEHFFENSHHTFIFHIKVIIVIIIIIIEAFLIKPPGNLEFLKFERKVSKNMYVSSVTKF